jgi:hypothetical protein
VKLVTTSVVRGSHQGESHGGVYLIDLEQRDVRQVVDWNTTAIDWQGRGWDRGLRGIAFDGEVVYIAASDELFAYTPTSGRSALATALCLPRDLPARAHAVPHIHRLRLILGFDLTGRLGACASPPRATALPGSPSIRA